MDQPLDLPPTYLQYWPVLLVTVGALIFALGAIILSALLTKRHPNPVKQEPYECGIPVLAPARIQVSVKYYLLALLFLLFDMETMFILAWAVTFDDPTLRLFSLIEMAVFIGILLVGYVYAWRKGALQWN
jgi:NADH-quinone oxidoreductase subunit A